LFAKDISMSLKRSGYHVFLLLVFLLPASEAVSDGISYDYAQADYISDTFDLNGSISEVEGNGIGFALSLSFAPAFAVRLSVASTTFRDFYGVWVDSSKVTVLGVTGHTSVTKKTDLFANVSAIKAEIVANKDANASSGSDYSVLVDVGVRHRVTDKFELEAMLSRVKVFAYTLNSTMVSGRYYFHERLSAGASYVADDIHDSLVISVRMDI